MASVWDIDRLVDEMSFWPLKKFYPTAVEKQTGLPLHIVFEYLLKLVTSGKLDLQWELRCPNYSCVRTIRVYDELPTELGFMECPICGEEIEITPDMLFPVFRISQGYKEHIRIYAEKKTRNHAGRLLSSL